MGFPECAAALPECDRYKKKRFCTRFCTFDIIEPSFFDWWRQITDPAIYIGLWDRIISERVLPSVEDSMSAPNPALLRETFPVGPLQCNCTIIGDPLTKKAIVVDPGGNPDLIMARLDALGLKVVSIIHTHAHLDHFLASGQMKEKTGATLHLHKEDQFLWDNLEMQCQMFGVPYTPVPSPDRWLSDDEELACGCGVALHTPGHTPGSMSFWFSEAKLLIAGDTLFRRGVGRTDLWGGDQATIVRSIKQRLYTLDEDATVVAGHGPDTRLGDEMRENPFVRA
ncbi:UNVERIFIED_ORG: glyoxylase-like metal-dependent hydrolase (beta-lactamase superfamily II) [Pseudomonas fluorescens]|nr:glyoxylase-like metal-dependent hydrolase (beta-lactamase superfamily II) [Pseudomonas fluorescens]